MALTKLLEKYFFLFFLPEKEQSALSTTHFAILSSKGSLNLFRKGTKFYTHLSAFQATDMAPLVPASSLTKEM
jgi:hypothetical protein